MEKSSAEWGSPYRIRAAGLARRSARWYVFFIVTSDALGGRACGNLPYPSVAAAKRGWIAASNLGAGLAGSSPNQMLYPIHAGSRC